MSGRPTGGSIDDYIAGFPPRTQQALQEMRRLIRSAAPAAVETISYAMPTFDLRGRHVVHFAGYERHIGFYPTPGPIEAFQDDLKPYKSAKGSVQFPLDQPLPLDLIRRMVEFRLDQLGGGDDAGAAR
jgi:uncharacterized protein YdhG (YjbR/CyaY superfamily)